MKKYGCFDRPPYKTSQVLYGHDSLTGKGITIEIPNRLAQDCRYTHTELGQADERCAGCKWRSGGGPLVAQDPSGEAPGPFQTAATKAMQDAGFPQ